VAIDRVRRRGLAVEALFWFHPMVWWLERRLVDERERACDEEVIRFGSEPQLYTESILKTCEFYIESPLIVAGVTGSDLKMRVEAIMRGDTGRKLKTWKKLLLATVGVATIAAPITVGVPAPSPVAR
jgi:bla regulator protein BlaR1